MTASDIRRARADELIPGDWVTHGNLGWHVIRKTSEDKDLVQLTLGATYGDIQLTIPGAQMIKFNRKGK